MTKDDPTNQSAGKGSTERRKILVVGTGDAFSEETVSYAVHLAERLDYDLVALSVDESGRRGYPDRWAAKAAGTLKRRAAQKGIRCEHAVKAGDPGWAVDELQHEIRRIEFVVTDLGVNREEVAREVGIPMFSVISGSMDSKGGTDMTKEQGVPRKRPVARTLAYGLLTAAMYGAVFWNADAVMGTFTRGGWYAAFPVGTVFLFSFAHGAFAANLWSLLGIEARKKPVLRETEPKASRKKKSAQKRPRAYAYVNPFHRIDKA
ncbi:MAG TPA: hypothetical protein PLM79_07080 [Syntrophobacteraceae bacterium]|nr:hypothetical protein [Syntrophobacteraceae bacterium]